MTLMASDEKGEGETMELHLQLTLPRGIPVVAFVALCQAFEGIVKAFVRGCDMDDDLVEIRIGPLAAEEREENEKRG